ncbi:MAG: Type 1 glutamine amidotransferase-like domain-containing protein [Actinomycetota bacterium]
MRVISSSPTPLSVISIATLRICQLFTQPNAPVRDQIMNSDMIWVGGGSVANLLALWSLHGVDSALREAYEEGIVLGGVSAGSICWHQGGPTDSFGAELRTVTNALALLPYGNAVHYDSEAQRRPKAHELIANETFTSMYATDDGVGILYENEIAVEVIGDRSVARNPLGGAAYFLEKAVEKYKKNASSLEQLLSNSSFRMGKEKSENLIGEVVNEIRGVLSLVDRPKRHR